MSKITRAAFALATLAAAVVFSGAANASTYTLTDTNGGSGSVSGTSTSFTLVGSNNEVGQSLTTYGTTVDSFEILSFSWSYVTSDWDGSYDPAGYYLNGSFVQLSSNSAESGAAYTGSSTVTLHTGDTFGWYVNSVDSAYGAAVLSVEAVSSVPETGNAALMLAGLAAMGLVARRRKSA